MSKVHQKMVPKVTDKGCATFCIASHVTFLTVQSLWWLHTFTRCCTVRALPLNVLRPSCHPQITSAEPAARQRISPSAFFHTQAVAFWLSSGCLVQYSTQLQTTAIHTATYRHNKDYALYSIPLIKLRLSKFSTNNWWQLTSKEHMTVTSAPRIPFI